MRNKLAAALITIALGGITGPFIPTLRLETAYWYQNFNNLTIQQFNKNATLPPSAPVIFDPLIGPDGTTITPINTNFSIIIPKIGVNASVLAGVDPSNPSRYRQALALGVAHAATSFLPDQDGTVYLFSHSTNYDWFVDDLNAVFYLLKNLESGDTIVVFYRGIRYTYRLTDKKVVSPNNTAYLFPEIGQKKLILQTCWPPGSTSQRLLIFADLVEEQNLKI